MKLVSILLTCVWLSACTADPDGDDSFTVLEYEVQLPMKNADEVLSECTAFYDAEKKVQTFFSVAQSIKEAPRMNRRNVCIATGVAKDNVGDVVDWEIVGGRYGEISRKGQSKWFSCILGSRCCEELPDFCREPL